jgi:hypothetical protein
MNNPARRNALSRERILELIAALTEIGAGDLLERVTRAAPRAGTRRYELRWQRPRIGTTWQSVPVRAR